MREETASSRFVSSLLDYAVRRGAEREGLLGAAGIEASLLADPDARVAFSCYVRLMRAAQQALADPLLSLHFGEAVPVEEFSIVALIGQASETMLDAFTQLSRYVALIVDVELEGPERFAFLRDGRGLWVADMRARPNEFPELSESAFAHIIAGPRRAGFPQWVHEVWFTHPTPAEAAEHERVFGAPVRFGAARNAMRIDEAIVTHKVALLPRYVFGVLTDHADAMLRELEAAGTMRGRVESALMPMLHTREAGMETVAARLGLSRQTLYRSLKAEGVTFEQVLDALRHKLALEYLRGRKATVNDTAYLVGFSDPAAFSRAFKRWTGKTPSEARGEG